MEKNLKTKISKRLTTNSFKIGKRYLITWKNFGKQVISRGSVMQSSMKSTKFICFKDDKLDATTIIPIAFIISHKAI